MRMLHHLSRILGSRFALLAALIVSSLSVAYAQGQYALLTHDGATQVFSGTNALIDANEAAVDGDIITLSAGSFKSIALTKNLTIRGAGMNIDGQGTSLTINRDLRDQLGNQFAMVINPENEGKVIIEDIEILAPELVYGVNAPTSLKICGKSNVDIMRAYVMPRLESFTGKLNMVNCMIDQGVVVDDSYAQADNMPNMIGCIILSGDVTNCNMTNCTVTNGTIGGAGHVENSLAVGKNQGATKTMSNCVIVSAHTSEDNWYNTALQTSEDNSPTSKYLTARDVFQQGDNTYNLLDNNAAEWLGSDGTQVGAHGGLFPFTTLTSSPRIVKLDVANRTTSEGILDVTICIE